MTARVSPEGALVGLAVFAVIAYELRTVLEAFGVGVPLVPYLVGVLGTAVLVGIVVVLWTGRNPECTADGAT